MISKELMLLCYKNQWISAYGGTHCWMELCALVPLLMLCGNCKVEDLALCHKIADLKKKQI